MHRGRVGDADDRTLAGLQSSDGLSPRLGTCVVEQREALLLQLVRCDLDGLSVRDLELDARLWHRPLHWPVRRAEACLRSLSQGPDPEGLALSLIHISEPTRLGMISYAVFCLKKKKN